ncbi:hypothetical protein ACHQM5_027696 [Ranunculus cassubicifolius]
MLSISDLPEGCITNIISFTSPRDACASSLVSSTFKSAADSDVVWEKFLPSDYTDILSRSVSPLSFDDFPSKKQLYFRLCDDPVLIDGGKKSFNLEKRSGKKCFTVGARELVIAWGESPRYWEWQSHPDSRFSEVVELKDVCFLEILGKIETKMLSPKTTYVAYFVFKYVEGGAHGLDYPAAEGIVEFVGEGGNASGHRSVYLDHHHETGLSHLTLDEGPEVAPEEGQLPKRRGDGWMEVEIGEFYNDQGEDGDVKMIVQEVKGGHWKRGIIVEAFELRPNKTKRLSGSIATSW